MILSRLAKEFAQAASRQAITSMNACVRCGLCAEACPFFRSEPALEHIPAYRTKVIKEFYRAGAKESGRQKKEEDKELDHLMKTIFGSCTMCRRCTLHCPMGVDTAELVRITRGVLEKNGYAPKGLKDTLQEHLEKGNNMGVSKEDFVETLEWMEEQLREEVRDEQARIPIDWEGADVLYLINPREVKFYPLTILAVAKIFYVAGTKWTVSSKAWDATNYALFSGNDSEAAAITRMIVNEARQLGVKEVVVTECGHGYRSLRWEGEKWIGEKYPFAVRSFTEVMSELVNGKAVNLKFQKIKEPLTYHDPCNQARNGGIVDEPRMVLAQIAEDFREMTPRGVHNLCCGGGGGLLAATEYASLRLTAGKAKAGQIAATKASLVVTSCHNCLDQLAEISRHYRLGVKVKNLAEVLAQAIEI